MTSLVLHESKEARDGHVQSGMEPGAAQTFDRLEELLHLQLMGEDIRVPEPMERELEITRVFDAPRELVYEAWTDPGHIRHWQGCVEAEITSCEVDLRPGGAWHYCMRMLDGSAHTFKGVYREIVPNRRLVHSSCYDIAAYGRPAWLTTITFEPFHNGTKLTHTILHKTTEMRDNHLKSGMEKGMAASFARLDERAEQIGHKS